MGVFFSTHALLARHLVFGLALLGLLLLFGVSLHLAAVIGVLFAVALMILTGALSLFGAFSMEGVVFGKTGLLLTDVFICASTALYLILFITPLPVRFVLSLLIVACVARVVEIVRRDEPHASRLLIAASAFPGIGLVVSGIGALIEFRRELKET